MAQALMDINELAKSFKVSVRWIQKAVSSYGLPHYKLGRLLRFKEDEVAAWLEQRRHAG